MLGLMFGIWLFLAVGLPVLIYGWSVGRANHFEVLEDSVYESGCIVPRLALAIQQEYVRSEREVAILWLISGFGNIIGLMFSYGHFVTYSRLLSEYQDDYGNYVMWHYRHRQHQITRTQCQDCLYCEGEWYYEEDPKAVWRT